jgi:type IV pilus assembly protein PilV
MMRKQNGFSLIEVLAALAVFSFGMLGMGKMLMLAMKSNSSAYSGTQATSLANAMLDRMRANRANSLQGSSSAYSLPALTSSATFGSPPTNCATIVCSNTDLATYDVATWLASLSSASALPSGRGSIVLTTVNAQVSVAITVQWDDSVTQKALNEAINPASFTLTSTL